MFKVIIAGGRDFNDYSFLEEKCNFYLKDKHPDVEIVSGTAKGADKLGEVYASYKGYPIKRFPADWDKFGKGAGYRRNAEMADYGDALIAFHNKKSRGTKHMIDLANEYNLNVRVVNYINLPLDYNKLDWRERRKIRNEYIRLQNNKCCHCSESLDKNPSNDVRSLSVDKSLFPNNFFKHPIHLHHNHNTGMTIGAVHSYCNAVLWQYYGE